MSKFFFFNKYNKVYYYKKINSNLKISINHYFDGLKSK